MPQSCYRTAKGKCLNVLGFNDTLTPVGHFVASPRVRKKRDRKDRRDERVTGEKEENEWKRRNRRIKNIPHLPFLAAWTTGLGQQ